MFVYYTLPIPIPEFFILEISHINMSTIRTIRKPHREQVPSETFSTSLDNLGVTASGEYAYLTMDLSSKDLYSLMGIESYIHIQHLNISHNNLITLKPLRALQHIITVDASFNQLTKLLDFEPPSNLLYADFSHNKISEIPNLNQHWYLQVLKLDSNSISEISGVSALPNLQLLSLSNNLIEEIKNLPSVIQILNLANNKISKLRYGFEGLDALRSLNLSSNNLISIKGIQYAESLMTVDLSRNKLRKILNLKYLEELGLLSDLNLIENPVQKKMLYRLRVLFLLPQLRSLDETEVSAEEKIKAENLYGLDVEDRRALFTQIFLGQAFEDRRLERAEMLDIESESDEDTLTPIDDPMKSIRNLKSNRSNGSKLTNRSNSSISKQQLLSTSRKHVGDLIDRSASEKEKVVFVEGRLDEF
jgi:Leucine-rich repeat (LRR) protein